VGIELPDDLPKRFEDALYVSVGFGVLAVQRAQVRRRELERAIERVLKRVAADRAPRPGAASP